MSIKDLKEEFISSKTIHTGRILTYTVDTVKLPSGKEGSREIIIHNGGVTLVPMLDSNKVVLVKQYRYPIKKAIWELPAGRVNMGEDPVNAGKRELKEETGYIAGKLESLGIVYPLPGYSTEVLYFFKATELIDDEPEPDEDEYLEVKVFDLKQAWQMVKDGEIRDGKTIAGLSLVMF